MCIFYIIVADQRLHEVTLYSLPLSWSAYCGLVDRPWQKAWDGSAICVSSTSRPIALVIVVLRCARRWRRGRAVVQTVPKGRDSGRAEASFCERGKFYLTWKRRWSRFDIFLAKQILLHPSNLIFVSYAPSQPPFHVPPWPLQAVARSLRSKGRCLQKLDLEGNSITDRGAQAPVACPCSLIWAAGPLWNQGKKRCFQDVVKFVWS